MLFFGQCGVSWKIPEVPVWKDEGETQLIPDPGFSYPAGFSVFKFQARTGMQIEAICLLIEDRKLKVGSYLTSELFPLLCFVASAHFTSSIRSNETQTPSCQRQRGCAFFPDTSFPTTAKLWDKVVLRGLLRCAGHREVKACNLGVSQPQYVWEWHLKMKREKERQIMSVGVDTLLHVRMWANL